LTNITVLDDYQDVVRKLDCARLLEPFQLKVFTNNVKGLGQLSVRLRDADVLVLIRERTHISRALLQKLPRLKLIVLAGGDEACVDIAACTAQQVAVAAGADDARAPAELTWALIMAAMRRLPQYIFNLKRGAWQQSGFKAASMPNNFGLGTSLYGRTLGIWGYGRVGRQVARYGQAFGMQVCAWGSSAARQRAQADGLLAAASRADLFANADVLSLHLRLGPKTYATVRAQDLALMKPAALLVNTARAELIEPEALQCALRQGRPGLAAVDVFEAEPILQGHALLRLENCICTPHIGYVEQDSYEALFRTAFAHVTNFIAGHPSGLLNPNYRVQ